MFWFDAEKVHHFAMNSFKLACRIGFIKRIIIRCFRPSGCQPLSLFKIEFPNRIGLGAGFDKNASYLNELEALGFGFVEIGTVTPLAQPGNERPRLFRLPKDKALINRMGFNNEGAEVIAKRLKDWRLANNQRQKPQSTKLVIGGNIGKNKLTPNEAAWTDYVKCFNALHEWVDYFVVNVSSPNTPGLRELQEKEALKKILTSLQELNAAQQYPKPILLKIAPDLSREQLDDVIDLAVTIKLDGLVATNTTISRDGLQAENKNIEQIGAGGLSGLPLKAKSTSVLQYILQQTNGQLPVIASGGIFTAADAKEKLDAGAELLQVWTGFIYEGPGIVKKICKSLAT